MYRSQVNHQIKCILDGSCLDEIIRRRHLITCIIQKGFPWSDFLNELTNCLSLFFFQVHNFFFFLHLISYLEARPCARALEDTEIT